MKLKKVEINNFKGLKRFEMDLQYDENRAH